MSALDIPGFSALQCVISSLRDTAHFTDEEGDLTDKLRDLRDWVSIRAAVQAAQPEAVGEPWGVDAYKLLSQTMKPSEIAGPADAQRRRVGELLSWFVRLADGQANPKWTAEHAFELAYYIASAPTPEPMSAPTEAKPATQPICDGCGKTIPEHDALLRCKAEATQQASGEREADYWAVLNAEMGFQAVFQAEKEAKAVAEQHDEAGYSQAIVRPLIYRDRAALSPAQQDAVDASIPLDKEELAQLIAAHLGLTYHCTRVWEAWNVGTMSQDDFEPVDESETPTEIAEAIIDAIRAAISAKEQP